MRIERVESEHVLAWRSEDGNWVWTFILESRDGSTRLISRNRFRLPTLAARLGMVPTEPPRLSWSGRCCAESNCAPRSCIATERRSHTHVLLVRRRQAGDRQRFERGMVVRHPAGSGCLRSVVSSPPERAFTDRARPVCAWRELDHQAREENVLLDAAACQVARSVVTPRSDQRSRECAVRPSGRDCQMLRPPGANPEGGARRPAGSWKARSDRL
jgi:hypothetical protein